MENENIAPELPESSAPTAPEVPAAGGDQPPADLMDHTASVASLESLAVKHLDKHPGFDPAIHAANEDGSPKRRADGSYAMKRGRKAGGSHLPGKGGEVSKMTTAPAGESGAVTPQVVQAPRISPDEAARQSANLVINAAVWICGEEIGKPSDKAEAEGLKISFVNYYESRGVPNIPPEIGLFLALGSYLVPRFRNVEEKTGKISKAIAWAKFKLGIAG